MLRVKEFKVSNGSPQRRFFWVSDNIDAQHFSLMLSGKWRKGRVKVEFAHPNDTVFGNRAPDWALLYIVVDIS